MKKILYSLPLGLLAGCSTVKDALDTAKDGLLSPPSAVLDALRAIGEFLLNLLVQLATNVFGPLLGKLGIL